MEHCLKLPESRKTVASRQPVFFILEQDALIATDLSQILESAGPCQIVLARDLRQARRALADVPALGVAFLEMDAAAFVRSWLAPALHARGALPIFTLGEPDEAQMHARGWGSLVRPFTEQAVLDTLSGLLGKR